jgi:chromosome segregation ATPase
MPLDKEIRVKEEGSDFSCQDEMRELRRESQVQKLSQRITLLSILIPCVLSAIIIFVYLEFNDRLNKISTIRRGQVEALSENVDDKIVSLSNDSRELEKEIKKLTTSKADKKTLEQAIRRESAQTAKTLKALRNQLNGQKQAVENLDATLKKEVVQILQVMKTLKTDRQKQGSAIKDLSEHKLDKEDFGNILKDKWSDYQARISLLRKEIKALKDEVSKVQRKLNVAITSNMASKAKGAPSKEKPAGATTKGAAMPTPGKIIEQEITE